MTVHSGRANSTSLENPEISKIERHDLSVDISSLMDWVPRLADFRKSDYERAVTLESLIAAARRLLPSECSP